MSREPGLRHPPERARALLRRFLPDGVLGLSILGDLDQEYDELVRSGRALPDLWYWASAVALSARYAVVRGKAAWTREDSVGGRMTEAGSALCTDVKLGGRMLRKTPLLSTLAVVTIGVGIALTTHTFSTVYGTVLRDIPVPGQDRLVYIGETRVETDGVEEEMPIHDFEELRLRQSSFEGVAAFHQGTVNMSGGGAPPERFVGAYVSGNMLDLVGVQPARGRLLGPDEEGPDAPRVIVVGHHVWENRFAGDPSIIGRSIRVNGSSTEIVGVMPEGFRFPFLEDVWLPHRLDPATIPRGRGQDLDVFGKLREGTSMAAARSDVTAIAGRLEDEHPETNRGVGMYVQPYGERFVPREIQAVLWVMMAATFGVLLIACVNVANLLMARASIRSKEIAVRTALGASRWRVVRQLMMESMMVAVLGGVLGVALAWWSVDAHAAILADIQKPYWIGFRVDAPVLAFSLAVTCLAATLAGTLPAMRASGLDVSRKLKDESRGASSLRLGRLSHGLVVTEIAVSCALLVGAGLMVRSVINVSTVELGFEEERILTGRLALFESDYPDVGDRERFFTELEERLGAEPGVEAATVTSSLPGLGTPMYYLGIEGVAYAGDDDYPAVRTSVVSPGFFETFGVEIVRGRDFDALDVGDQGEPVAIVSESFVATYLRDASALGERIRLGRADSERPWRRIVGIVPDMHVGGNVGGIGDDRERRERVFLPLGALDLTAAAFAIRTRDRPEAMAPAVRALVAELDPDLPVYDLAPMARALDDSTWAFGLFGSLFTAFGVAALFLATVGLYGVMAFGVSQRRREMAVRLALGARPRELVRMIVGDGARQVALGLLIGLGLGAVLSRSMQVVLYGMDADDPVVYLVIVVTLTATGLLASVLPARAATRTDPMRAMQAE